LTHTYAQVIDDSSGRTVAAASTVQLGAKKNDTDAAAAVGSEVAKRAQAAGVARVVFDRGGYQYHGRIKALADAARAAGLEL
jgi:large subunit ribosomal protein L18